MGDQRAAPSPARPVPLDERVVDATGEVAWVESAAANSAQLRFHDRIQGAVCLRPSWSDYARLAVENASLQALVGDGQVTGPGSVLRSSYQSLFPAAVVLSGAVEGAHEAPLSAAPRILVVGLGAGAGVVLLAHHWPRAQITVVEVDARVVELALRHHPLLRWLEGQEAAGPLAGRRLRILRQDARELSTTLDTRPARARFDAIILDAFTPAGGVPGELAGPAFITGLVDGLLADGGTVLSNVPGSYSGPGAGAPAATVERMARAGLTESHNFPMPSRSGRGFHPADGRNNLVVSARHRLRLGPGEPGAARLAALVPYPDLPAGCAVSEELVLGRAGGSAPAWTAPLPAGPLGARLQELLGDQHRSPVQGTTTTRVEDAGLAAALAGDVGSRFARRLPAQWRREWNGELAVTRSDHLLRLRALVADVVTEALRTGDGERRPVHDGRSITGGATGST